MLFPYCISLQYFGGTNFGRTAGGPMVATSYDYDAPLDEYGNLRHVFNTLFNLFKLSYYSIHYIIISFNANIMLD